MSAPSELLADDEPVARSTPVYRLIPTDHCGVGEDGQWAFQSAAFDNNDGNDMSVVLGDTLEALGRRPEDLPEYTFGDSTRWGVAVLRAADLFDEEQEILRTRQPGEPAHADVRGPKNPRRRKRIKKRAQWVVRPGATPTA